jgi:hypothetical protein
MEAFLKIAASLHRLPQDKHSLRSTDFSTPRALAHSTCVSLKSRRSWLLPFVIETKLGNIDSTIT